MPDEMDPMLDFEDEIIDNNPVIGWDSHALTEIPTKSTGLDGVRVPIDTIPVSRANNLASARNIPKSVKTPMQFWKLFFNDEIISRQHQTLYRIRSNASSELTKKRMKSMNYCCD